MLYTYIHNIILVGDILFSYLHKGHDIKLGPKCTKINATFQSINEYKIVQKK